MSNPSTTLRAYPRPGRLTLHGCMPAAEPAALAAAGRQVLGRLRAALFSARAGTPAAALLRGVAAPLPRGLAPPLHRGPPADDLPSLAVQAALAAAGWQAESLVVCLMVENATGDSASLSWRRDGDGETLHWSWRGGPIREDGACHGSATVAAALAR